MFPSWFTEINPALGRNEVEPELTCVSAADKMNNPSAAIMAAEVSAGRFEVGASKSLPF
jgi:hypothetical protein